MSEETPKNNNAIMTAAIIALVAGVGYFAFSSNDNTTDPTITTVTMENGQTVEEVVVVAEREPTEVTAEMVVNSTDDNPENEIKPESSEDKSE